MNWNLPRPVTPLVSWMILINVIFSTVIGVFSASAGFVGGTTIQGALQLSNDDSRWISISLIMMLGIILPVAIYLAEKYGYKLILFLGIAVFALGSLLNGMAIGFWSFFISRAVAGIGAGALFPLSIAIIDKIFPKEKLLIPLALYVGLGFGVGTGIGMYFSGYLTQFVSWQSPFIVCALLSIPALISTWVLHPEVKGEQHKKFDTLGYTVFTIFIAAILVILVNGKADWNTRGWHSPFMVSCYMIGAFSLIALLWIETKSHNPVIILSLFKTKSFLIGCIAIFFVGAPLYATQMLYVSFFDVNLGYEKHLVGNYMATLGVTLGLFSALAAFLTRIINIRILTLMGMVLITISCLINPMMTLYSSHGEILGILNLRIVGVALALGPATSLAMSEISVAFGGAASVFITLARQFGGTIGSLVGDITVIERGVFHNARFGSQVDPQSPAFQEVAHQLQTHLIRNSGADPLYAATQAEGLIRDNIMTQSQVTAMTDFFFLLGIVSCVICLGLLAEMVSQWRNKRIQKSTKPKSVNSL